MFLFTMYVLNIYKKVYYFLKKKRDLKSFLQKKQKIDENSVFSIYKKYYLYKIYKIKMEFSWAYNFPILWDI